MSAEENILTLHYARFNGVVLSITVTDLSTLSLIMVRHPSKRVRKTHSWVKLHSKPEMMVAIINGVATRKSISYRSHDKIVLVFANNVDWSRFHIAASGNGLRIVYISLDYYVAITSVPDRSRGTTCHK